jgi:hypothetical protein
MPLHRKRQGRDQTMRKKIVKQCIGAVLASLVFAAYPATLVGAQIVAPTTVDHPQANGTIVLKVKELTDQGLNLQQIQSELQTLLNSLPMDIQKREQSSLSLRGFYPVSLFSCRGFA